MFERFQLEKKVTKICPVTIIDKLPLLNAAKMAAALRLGEKDQ